MKGLIHKGYFREVFRQLRVIGIVAAAILMLSNLSTFITLVAQYSDSISYYSIPSGATMASIMSIYVYITGLVFTFSAFGWLNKRSTSDFYHALPIKRTQIYFSSILAILIWMAIGLGAYAVVHAVIYLVLGMPFNYLLFLCVFVNMLVGALEVVAAVSIACSISGTRFVNLFASAVILFIPRFMLTVLSVFVKRVGSDTLVVNTISLLFDPSYNIIATPYAPMLNSLVGLSGVDYANGWAMLYNLVYDAVLFVLGWIAFKKRKSETAGLPTAGRFFNGVIRTAVGLPFLLLLVYIIIAEGFEIVPTVILVLVSFVIFCLYELISTKRPKKMFKAMPLFFICIGISLLYLVIPHIVDRIERSVSVTSQNVKGYWLVNDNDRYSFLSDIFMDGTNGSSYSDIKSERVEITDPESIEIVTQAYNDSLKTNLNTDSYYNLTVKIDRKFGRDITRNIPFSPSKYSKLMAIRNVDPEIHSAKTEFPSGHNFYIIETLSRQDSAIIGKSFEEEFNKLSDVDKFSLNTDFYSYNSNTLHVFGFIGANNYSNTYELGSLTPRTTELYFKLLNDKNGERFNISIKAALEWMETGNGDNVEFYIGTLESMQYLTGLSSWSMRYYIDGNIGDKTPKQTDPGFYELLSIIADAPLHNGNNFATVVQFNDYSSFLHDSSLYVVKDFTNEQLDRIHEIMESYDSYNYDYIEEIDYD